MPSTRFPDALGALARAVRPPSVCAICRGWGARRVCATCFARFALPAWRCRRCALRVPEGQEHCGACLIDPPPFAAAWAAVDYGHPWDALISRFKFQGALDLAGVLASLLPLGRGPLLAADRAPTPDLDTARGARLLPVPLSDARLRERGYNQAWELARRAARATGLVADAHLLLRVRHAPHQLAFPPEERAGNVRGAFAVEPRRLDEVRGRRFVLVDDVMTTGATLAEAARTLLGAGATEVGVWVVARTPRPGGP